MIDTLYRFIEHRARWWIVITGTLLIGLIMLWPAVDEYFAAQDRYRELQDSLNESKDTVSNLDRFSNLVSQRQLDLAQLEQQTLTEEAVAQFRNKLVQMVRHTGCRMRRVRLGEPTTRPWKLNDDPLTGRSSNDTGNETPFELRTQLLSISLTGPEDNIGMFLTELRKLDSFIHTMNLNLRRSQDAGKEAVLEIDLLLIDLGRPDKISA